MSMWSKPSRSTSWSMLVAKWSTTPKPSLAQQLASHSNFNGMLWEDRGGPMDVPWHTQVQGKLKLWTVFWKPHLRSLERCTLSSSSGEGEAKEVLSYRLIINAENPEHSRTARPSIYQPWAIKAIIDGFTMFHPSALAITSAQVVSGPHTSHMFSSIVYRCLL